jgi:hypothetical protein
MVYGPLVQGEIIPGYAGVAVRIHMVDKASDLRSALGVHRGAVMVTYLDDG